MVCQSVNLRVCACGRVGGGWGVKDVIFFGAWGVGGDLDLGYYVVFRLVLGRGGFASEAQWQPILAAAFATTVRSRAPMDACGVYNLRTSPCKSWEGESSFVLI